ncbi:MAG: CoA transferase [Firmicutes bacterium]|nr:CoA transferase [Bacillota bacterium]
MKALEGIKVLDLTRVLVGPYCTMILADLGAEVIKVERPEVGDDSRSFSPFIENESAYFISLNRGKKSIDLDLKEPKDKLILEKLIEKVDVIVENFRPGTMEKLGFGYEDIKKINPSIIYASMSGFGHTGPLSKYPAYDMIVQAMGGIMSITGEENSKPVRVGSSIGDITAGLFGTIGILAALNNRSKTNEGQKVDISMLDCQVAILENAIQRYEITGKIPKPLGTKHPSIAPFQAFKSKDSYIIIAAGNDNLFKKMCKAMYIEKIIEDERFKTNKDRLKNQDELINIIEKLTIKKTTKEWIEIFSVKGVPAGPIDTIDKVINNPQVNERDMIVNINHPRIGDMKVAGSPIKLSKTPVEIEKSAPDLGEHKKWVFKHILKLNDNELKELL